MGPYLENFCPPEEEKKTAATDYLAIFNATVPNVPDSLLAAMPL